MPDDEMPVHDVPNEAVPIEAPLARFALFYRYNEFISTASHVGKTMLANFQALLLRQLTICTRGRLMPSVSRHSRSSQP